MSGEVPKQVSLVRQDETALPYSEQEKWYDFPGEVAVPDEEEREKQNIGRRVVHDTGAVAGSAVHLSAYILQQ
ncbi:hypothetical protein G7054_g6945 [Neopestalotiopsis clavispora]|nr:hypothetical protein G7054_g6945 [Neopestalotiopsis clavispora]